MTVIERKQAMADAVNTTLNKIAIRGDTFEIINVVQPSVSKPESVKAVLKGYDNETESLVTTKNISYRRQDMSEAIQAIYVDSDVTGNQIIAGAPSFTVEGYPEWNLHTTAPTEPLPLGEHPTPIHPTSFRWCGDAPLVINPKSYHPFVFSGFGGEFTPINGVIRTQIRTQNGGGFTLNDVFTLVPGFGSFYWVLVPIQVDRTRLNMTQYITMSMDASNIGNIEILFTKQTSPIYDNFDGFGVYRKNGLTGIKSLLKNEEGQAVTELASDYEFFSEIRYVVKLDHIEFSLWVSDPQTGLKTMAGQPRQMSLQGNTNAYILFRVETLVSGLAQPEMYISDVPSEEL